MNQIKVGAILAYLSVGLSLVIGVLYTPIMIREMGQSEYGIYTLALSIVSYLTLLDLGLGASIVRYVSYYKQLGDTDKVKKIYSSSLFIYSIIGFFCLIVGLLFFFNVENVYSEGLTAKELEKLKIIILIIVLYLSLVFPLTPFTSIIAAHERFVYRRIVKVITSVLMPLIMIPILFVGGKSISMAILLVLFGILEKLTDVFYCTKYLEIKLNYKLIDKKTIIQLFRFSLPVFGIMFCDGISRNFGQFYMGAVAGTLVVSIISLSMQLRGYIESIVKILSQFFLPRLSSFAAEGVSSTLVSIEFLKVSRLQSYLSFMLVFGFSIVGFDFVEFWVGKNYSEVYYVTTLMMFPLVIPMSESLGEELLKAYKMQKYQLLIFLLRIFMILVITVVGAEIVPSYSFAIAVCLSTLICDVILMNFLYVKKMHIEVKPLIQFFFKQFLICISIVIFLGVIEDYKLSFIIKGFLFVILYSLCAFSFLFNSDEKKFVQYFITLIKSKLLKYGNIS